MKTRNVTVKTEVNEEKTISMFAKDLSDGLDHNLTLYPRLNCFEQDDETLVEAIKEKILVPPSFLGQK